MEKKLMLGLAVLLFAGCGFSSQAEPTYTLGYSDAPVKLEFFYLPTCGHCLAFAQEKFPAFQDFIDRHILKVFGFDVSAVSHPGVTSTPTIFIGETKIVGNQGTSVFTDAIESEYEYCASHCDTRCGTMLEDKFSIFMKNCGCNCGTPEFKEWLDYCASHSDAKCGGG